LQPEQVKKLIDNYEQETESIKRSALQMSWYMRGGVSYEDILNMSSFERKQISDIIENNMEITKKSQIPFF
jgi:predicted RNA-binding protein Jag